MRPNAGRSQGASAVECRNYISGRLGPIPAIASNSAVEQFQHKITSDLRRDREGILLISSTCMKCGIAKAVSIRDGSLERWELEHRCGNLRVIHPKGEHL